jgi:hypothetical protein
VFPDNGGNWTWAMGGRKLDEISSSLGASLQISRKFPFSAGQFECIVAIDVLEHLERPAFLGGVPH